MDGCLLEVDETPYGCYWVSATYTKEVPNTFGVKMGMMLEGLKEIFGEKTKDANAPKGAGPVVEFFFGKMEELNGIKLSYEEGS